MITQIFPTNILIKDLDFSDEWNQNITLFVKSVFLNQVAISGNYGLAGNNSIPLFTEENINMCPELKELRNVFIDGFLELAQSYSNNELTREIIESRVKNETGKLPFMKAGDYNSIHTHTLADAFGIFYLSEVDNKKYGGELILHDPSFSNSAAFQEEHKQGVATKKHRLVICPCRVWHEVTMYTGVEDRATIVMNLNSF
jgi:hypothetical protein